MPNLFGDLTEEELRLQSEQFGDFEYKAAVAAKGGAFIQPAVEQADVNTILTDERVGTPSHGQLQGFAVPETRQRLHREELLRGEDTIAEGDAEYYGEVFEVQGKDPKQEIDAALDAENPSIFTIGATAANPGIQSHEYMHIALSAMREADPRDLEGKRRKALEFIQNNIPNKHKEEGFNRNFDVYRSNDEGPALEQIAVSLYNQTGDSEPLQAYPKEVLAEELAKVEKSISKEAEKFAKLEAAAQVLKGARPPKEGTWKEFYFKRWTERKAMAARRARKALGL